MSRIKSLIFGLNGLSLNVPCFSLSVRKDLEFAEFKEQIESFMRENFHLFSFSELTCVESASGKPPLPLPRPSGLVNMYKCSTIKGRVGHFYIHLYHLHDIYVVSIDQNNLKSDIIQCSYNTLQTFLNGKTSQKIVDIRGSYGDIANHTDFVDEDDEIITIWDRSVQPLGRTSA